ncbi:MAG: TRAM domain-containing protein [Spirochaetales bacterium]|nr:TRAM domain-containing protein [Spirochaetales bacterium]
MILVSIEKLVSGGDGLAHVDGQAVFVPGTVPGDQVLIEVPPNQGEGWLRALPQHIEKNGEGRVEPFCPHFDECGGCTWQHIAYSHQVEAKKAFCQDALLRQGGMTESLLPPIECIPSAPQGYRARIRPRYRGPREVGFRRTASDETLEIRHCPVAVSGINEFLAHPSLGVVGDEPVVFGSESQFWVQDIHDAAQCTVKEKVFSFPPGAFFQSNPSLLGPLVDFALEGAQGERAMDLYGGVGFFGAFLADCFDKVIGVERDKRARSAWLRHVGKKGIFFGTSLETWVKKKQRSPDFVVVDPPRAGLSAPVRRALITMAPARMTYVSCNPVTQARDLKDLRQAGYEIEAYQAFDLYPQTPHVETVARLVLKEGRGE